MNAVARSGIARLASFVPTATATLFTSRLIITHYGLAAFGSFALVLSLINLIPLNNLGVGAAVTSAYAAGSRDSEHARRTLLTSARFLTLSMAITALIAVGVGSLGLWPTLLGGASGPNLWCAIALIVYAVSFVPGLGTSMLLGVHRNHLTVLIQTFYNPLILVLVGVAIVGGVDGDAVMIAPCVALVVVHSLTSGIAGRITKTSWTRLLAALPNRRRHPGASIRAMSGPVLFITLSTPIALQSDRIVLSHVSSTQAVADYSVAMQIFAPALALIAASAQPLWPIWTAARTEGRRGPGVGRVLGLFCAAAIAIGAVLALIADPMASLIAGDRVHISALLAFSGGLAVLTAGASYPVAMSLMDPVGVRFVLACTLLALPANIGLSVVLGQHFGAPGPLLASCIVGLCVQALPGLVYSRDRQSAGRHRRPRKAEARLARAAVVAAITSSEPVPEGGFAL
jgi:O-antigen/teichoic acid export membrane protein